MLNDHKCFCDILGSDWNKNMTFCRSLQQCRIKMTDTKPWWFDLRKGQKRIIIQCISMFPSWQTFSFDRHWNQIEKEIDFIVKFTRSLICLFVIHGLTSCFFNSTKLQRNSFIFCSDILHLQYWFVVKQNLTVWVGSINLSMGDKIVTIWHRKIRMESTPRDFTMHFCGHFTSFNGSFNFNWFIHSYFIN